MDEALRAAERAGDWSKQAGLLRRTGRSLEARRVLEGAAHGGSEEALALLDAWFPLDAEAQAVLRLLEGDRVPSYGGLTFLGEWDPRIDRQLVDLEVSSQPLAPILQLPFVERVVFATGRFGPEVLARARFTPGEALEVCERVVRELPGGVERRVVILEAIWLLGRDGGEAAIDLLQRVVAEASDWLVAYQAHQALAGLGVAADFACLGSGLPVRPPWAPNVRPSAVRDSLTACYARRVHEQVGDAPWWMWIGIDRTKPLNDRHGVQFVDTLIQQVAETLQAHAGDRVFRWAGDEFLIPYEADDAIECAEACVRAVAAIAVPQLGAQDGHGLLELTISLGLGTSLQLADEALYQAKSLGRNRVVVGA